MEVSLENCSQNGGNLYRAPYYNGNPNIGPRIIGNLDQSPYGSGYIRIGSPSSPYSVYLRGLELVSWGGPEVHGT